ncbi:hypothetical protein TNIN_119101 [Trichonephila inaurata madagascariensis]|uniref:Uncharacterized protein n=1 Tax=Trichonephila inaurata madagascariensis TaxID=2747483 RepID=A0A8X6Y4I9_9ARAC|nr:hypothetical protein TNIN_119101 [Trichonephila inaurata madagascariensis]
MIRSFVVCFEELGSVADRPGRGAHQNICTEDNGETAADDLSVSTHHYSSQLGNSRTTWCRILKLNLKMYPYKIQIVQTLTPQDHLLREIFGQRRI